MVWPEMLANTGTRESRSHDEVDLGSRVFAHFEAASGREIPMSQETVEVVSRSLADLRLPRPPDLRGIAAIRRCRPES